MDTSYEGENLEDSEGDDNPFRFELVKKVFGEAGQ